jgi:hypothetical protein
MIRNTRPGKVSEQAKRRDASRDDNEPAAGANRVLVAAVTGLISGAARSVIDWLLYCLLGA